MSIAAALAVVLFVGAMTYTMRAGAILALADRNLPDTLVVALRNVAPAVLAALVVSLIADADAPHRGVEFAEIIGIAVACPVAWLTRNLAITLGLGMAAFWLALALT